MKNSLVNFNKWQNKKHLMTNKTKVNKNKLLKKQQIKKVSQRQLMLLIKKVLQSVMNLYLMPKLKLLQHKNKKNNKMN